MKEDRFRQLFAAFGTLTDCSLKFTKEGKFRKFGFIGFKSEEEAQAALNHFHRSFIDTSRITVSLRESHPACHRQFSLPQAHTSFRVPEHHCLRVAHLLTGPSPGFLRNRSTFNSHCTLFCCLTLLPSTRVIRVIELREAVTSTAASITGESGLLSSNSLEHLGMVRGSIFPKAASGTVSGARDEGCISSCLVLGTLHMSGVSVTPGLFSVVTERASW